MAASSSNIEAKSELGLMQSLLSGEVSLAGEDHFTSKALNYWYSCPQFTDEEIEIFFPTKSGRLLITCDEYQSLQDSIDHLNNVLPLYQQNNCKLPGAIAQAQARMGHRYNDFFRDFRAKLQNLDFSHGVDPRVKTQLEIARRSHGIDICEPVTRIFNEWPAANLIEPSIMEQERDHLMKLVTNLSNQLRERKIENPNPIEVDLKDYPSICDSLQIWINNLIQQGIRDLCDDNGNIKSSFIEMFKLQDIQNNPELLKLMLCSYLCNLIPRADSVVSHEDQYNTIVASILLREVSKLMKQTREEPVSELAKRLPSLKRLVMVEKQIKKVEDYDPEMLQLLHSDHDLQQVVEAIKNHSYPADISAKIVVNLIKLKREANQALNAPLHDAASLTYQHGCKLACELIKNPKPDAHEVNSFNSIIQNTIAVVREPENGAHSRKLNKALASAPLKKSSGWAIFGACALTVLGIAGLAIGLAMGPVGLGLGLIIGGGCFAAAGIAWGIYQRHQYNNRGEFSKALCPKGLLARSINRVVGAAENVDGPVAEQKRTVSPRSS